MAVSKLNRFLIFLAFVWRRRLIASGSSLGGQIMAALPDDGWEHKAACRGPQSSRFFPPPRFERKDELVERLELRPYVRNVQLGKTACRTRLIFASHMAYGVVPTKQNEGKCSLSWTAKPSLTFPMVLDPKMPRVKFWVGVDQQFLGRRVFV